MENTKKCLVGKKKKPNEKHDYKSVENGVCLSEFPIFAVNNTFYMFSQSKFMVICSASVFSTISVSFLLSSCYEISLRHDNSLA